MTAPAISQYVIPVPGWFRRGVVFLDLETEKVPVTDKNGAPFFMQNGEVLRMRWSAIFAGLARDGNIYLVDGEGEAGILASISNICWRSREVLYAATREFDEMIVKGRFTNARRAHEPKPFYPAAFGAETWNWRNLGPIPAGLRERREGNDLPSKGISQRMGDDWDGVAIHLLRDVVSLIIMGGEPDSECNSWCERVLSDTPFALLQIRGGDAL